MEKSKDAFRTISEVADWLDVPTHVLRFWESRFTQVKPVKRAGGRRYYRPTDMQLLGGIKVLLHDDGLTIRGVQKLLREQGVRHVAGMSPPLDGVDTVDVTPDPGPGAQPQPQPLPGAATPPEAAPEVLGHSAAERPGTGTGTDAGAGATVIDLAPAAPAPAPVLDPDEVLTRWPFADEAGEAEARAARAPAEPFRAEVPPDPADDADLGSGPAIAARLRGLSAAALQARAEALRPAAQRLAALHARLAAASPASHRG